MSRNEKEIINKYESKIHEEYEKNTKKSKETFNRAKKYLPGGNSRTTVFWSPYPLYFQKGKGFTIYDLDGNAYLDFIGNYTSLIHGHAHPKIIEAIKNVVERGTAAHMPTEDEVELAEIMCERFPSVDKIRFTNSGTEATLNTMRLARIYTGKNKFMKAEGAYHGTHLAVDVSVTPEIINAGSKEYPKSVPGLGTPMSVAKDIIVYPFNNQEITENIFKKHKEELAAVIVEPVMRTIPPKDGYLDFLREITSENDVLLIFDEVICSRISKGGSQEYYNVIPDLTAFGKIYGGGLPFGAFGGNEDIMMFSDPSRKKHMGHGGTFNANPLTMAAGKIATKMLNFDEIDKLNTLGDLQRKGMDKVHKESGIIAQLTGVGSLTTMHFVNKEVKDYRGSSMASPIAKTLNKFLYLSLINNGISTAKRIFTGLSTPMSKKEIEKFIEAYRKSIDAIKPMINNIAPNLIFNK